ncbi:MAG TPA: flagellar export protein FliJ [Rhizobiales bacterium]|nr:flagellar FliJ protein [bacterium BMS3Bbin10]HDO51219.1 flagellar export protein FliJ [Hyphomicrobiales bacterium]
MRSRKTLIQLRRFEVDERRQTVADIETMMGELQQMVVDLERQIQVEQEKAGVDDINHFAYPTFAKAAIQRRDNLKNSVRDLEVKLEEARDQLAEAFEELKKVELIEERDAERIRTQTAAREQAELDEIGLMRNMRLAGDSH